MDNNQIISGDNVSVNTKKEEVPFPLPANPWLNRPGETGSRRIRRESVSPFVGSNGKQYLAALAANMGAFAFGTVMSWSATALPDLRKDVTMGNVTMEQESLIASIVTLGAVAAGPITGYGVERFGRRKTMLMLTLPFVAGWLLITLAKSIPIIYFGRLVTGFCGGAFTLAAPIFTAEIASSHIRGTLAAGFDMMITVGMLYIFVVGTYLPWRLQALACGIIPLVFHALMFFVPESPRYLIGKGKRDEALKALCWFRGASSPSEVEGELALLNREEDFASCSIRTGPPVPTGSWKDLFESSALKPILIVFALFLFQELSGIDAVLFYTVDIFAASGADIDDYYSTIIVGVVQVIAATCAALVVDKSGRRFLLMISEIFMVLSLGALGLFFYLKITDPSFTTVYLGWLPLASLIIYVVSYSVGLGPITYMIMGEMLPHHVKGLASSILTSIKWLLGFAVSLFFKDTLVLLGDDGGFWLFASFCLLGGIFVFFFVPETKGKTLEEIQRVFQKKPSSSSGRRNEIESRPLLSEPKTYGAVTNGYEISNEVRS